MRSHEVKKTPTISEKYESMKERMKKKKKSQRVFAHVRNTKQIRHGMVCERKNIDVVSIQWAYREHTQTHADNNSSSSSKRSQRTEEREIIHISHKMFICRNCIGYACIFSRSLNMYTWLLFAHISRFLYYFEFIVALFLPFHTLAVAPALYVTLLFRTFWNVSNA